VKIPLQKIVDPLISSSGVTLFVLRLDQMHPHISGNKYFKLKYNLEEAKRQKRETLVTFGGAYSNHIAAVAAAGKEFGFKTIGIIRGDELHPAPVQPHPQPFSPGRREQQPLNNTLRFAKDCGMQLHFVSREEYRNKNSSKLIHSLTDSLNHYILPEGGTNELAVKGCAEILSLIDIPFDHVCCAVGTGGTLAGIVSSLKGKQRAIGFSVLKGGEFLKKEVEKLLTSPAPDKNRDAPPSKGELNSQYHFGGYGKYTPQLLKFIDDFEKQNNIPLEQVYTGKMMFGIYDLIQKGRFKRNETIVAVHTGGLQGKLH
jgi:1-aminocyclopropane-1-carboxylate deaminase/D-cysteine desulfhydrase-like pyridoxal-dependent ACC family enzyme